MVCDNSVGNHEISTAETHFLGCGSAQLILTHRLSQYFVHGSDELQKVEQHRGISVGTPGQRSAETKQKEPA